MVQEQQVHKRGRPRKQHLQAQQPMSHVEILHWLKNLRPEEIACLNVESLLNSTKQPQDGVQKRGRGRPRKHKTSGIVNLPPRVLCTAESVSCLQKRARGCPRKRNRRSDFSNPHLSLKTQFLKLG